MSDGDLSGVTVVGSANLDVVVTLDRVPDRGETVFGTGYAEYSGGKGANQAVAAGRIAKTSLVASLGRDQAASVVIDHLRSRNVDVRQVIAGAPSTGRAFITVTPDGENSITVLSLANAALTRETVAVALAILRPRVVLTQQEISPAALGAAAQWCVQNDARFLVNASPIAPLPDGVLDIADPVIVNELEAEHLLGFELTGSKDHAGLARALLARSRSAVVTAGGRGAFVARGSTVTKIRAEDVRPLDTTGAGDEFAGTLAAALSNGAELLEAAAQANAAAARLIGIPRTDR